MTVLIVTNVEARKGLWRDALIFEAEFQRAGWQTTILDYRADLPRGRWDVVLQLEVCDPRWWPLGHRRWRMPNLEWESPTKLEQLSAVDLVLCRNSYTAMAHTWGARSLTIGFTSLDVGMGQPDQLTYLHCAGGSIARGTAAVARAWDKALDTGKIPAAARLVLVDVPDNDGVRNAIIGRQVERRGRLSDADLRTLQRASAIHVLASEHEGWGHLFWEGLSTGAHVIATDGPWWAEAAGAFRAVRSVTDDGSMRNLAHRYAVDEADMARAMVEAATLPPGPYLYARRAYEKITDGFQVAFGELLAMVRP